METGKPVVLVLANGRPLTLEWEDSQFSAIVEAWHGGSAAARGLVDVLFGDVNPSGKLTTTFPRSVGQIPLYYNAKKTGRPIRMIISLLNIWISRTILCIRLAMA